MKKTATAVVAAALALSLSVGAYASDQAQTVIESEENSTSIWVPDMYSKGCFPGSVLPIKRTPSIATNSPQQSIIAIQNLKNFFI